MPFYEYHCPTCNLRISTTSRTTPDNPPPLCPNCSSHTRRRYSFNLQPSFQEHYSPTTGSYLSNRRSFLDSLKRQADDNSEATGITHSYSPLTRAEMMDATALGVTGEGIERDL